MIIPHLPFEDYFARDAVSKSQLWELHTRSPAHARVAKEQSNAMAMGVAVHCAVLEPDCFRERFVRGPEDRRGNKWKEAQEEHGSALLVASDYDAALEIRDALMHEPVLRGLVRDADVMLEASGFAPCADTGLPLRCRPDAWRPSLGVIADLKVTNDARPEAFARRVEQFGYHAQEAHYTDTWSAALDDADAISAFVFITVEPKPPYAYAIYELEPSAVIEGRLRIAEAKKTWAACATSGVWPGYPREIQPLDLRKWAYKLTTPEENL